MRRSPTTAPSSRWAPRVTHLIARGERNQVCREVTRMVVAVSLSTVFATTELTLLSVAQLGLCSSIAVTI
jgi:hypothetical protein